ncbi:phage major capsid protein [Vreelandella sedimenti]|mgnify:CR=1 FL=1|uniref:phage major capsid protein n=1 Tax=Vreelandella sedimenti TaxID=2729618 RepID=UPI00257F1F77|nr:phage major capsid protein [Halomonas sp. UBA3173]|tara:strand:- start:150054 stop:151991 length:1938 start_codon:yes stop_codon:yes gene_type:complete
MTNKAYSILTVNKQYIDSETDERVITGIATTPAADRVNDVIVPQGVTFNNPLPLLWQHDHSKPVGTVYFEEPTEQGIKFVARIANIEDEGTLKDRCNEAWQSVKAGLVRGVSIGYRAIGAIVHIANGGILYTSTEVFELSLVTIPCNSDATIELIKSLDVSASATDKEAVEELINKEVEQTLEARQLHDEKNKYKKVYYKNNNKDNNKMKFAEQIKNIKAARADKIKSMEALVTNEDATLDEAQTAQYETLETEVKSLDAQLKRITDLEKMSASEATEVVETSNSYTPQSFNIKTQKEAPKGVGFARIAGVMAATKGNSMQAAEIAKRFSNTPAVAEYFKAKAVGMTDDEIWGGPLANDTYLKDEFMEMLRPATVFGKIQGFRNVPFNTKITTQTGGTSANWVGEGQIKPKTGMELGSVSLSFAKIAAIVPISDELARFSSPSAELLVRDDLVKAIAARIDDTLFDADQAETKDVPASLLNDVFAITLDSSKSFVDAVDEAASTIISEFSVYGGFEGAYFVMSEAVAINLGMMKDAMGRPIYEGMQGLINNQRTLFGLPVVTSNSQTISNKVVLMRPSEILVADDGGVDLSVNDSASYTDTNGNLVSAWENNLVLIRAERYIRWKKARITAAAYIDLSTYTPTAP